jgi:hypothetical protein
MDTDMSAGSWELWLYENQAPVVMSALLTASAIAITLITADPPEVPRLTQRASLLLSTFDRHRIDELAFSVDSDGVSTMMVKVGGREVDVCAHRTCPWPTVQGDQDVLPYLKIDRIDGERLRVLATIDQSSFSVSETERAFDGIVGLAIKRLNERAHAAGTWSTPASPQ